MYRSVSPSPPPDSAQSTGRGHGGGGGRRHRGANSRIVDDLGGRVGTATDERRSWRGGGNRRRRLRQSDDSLSPPSSLLSSSRRQRSDRGGSRGEGREFGQSRLSPRRQQTSSRTTSRVHRRSGTNRVPNSSTVGSYNYFEGQGIFDSSSDFEDLEFLQPEEHEADSFEDELMQELRASRNVTDDLYGIINLDFMNLSSVGNSPRRSTNAPRSSAVSMANRSGGGGDGSVRSQRNRLAQRGNGSTPSSSVNNSTSNLRSRGVTGRRVRARGQTDGAASNTSSNRRASNRRQGSELGGRDSTQSQREQRRRQQRVGNIVGLPASLRSFLLYGIDDLWPEEFDQEFFLGDQTDIHNSGLHYFTAADASSINNLPPTPRVAEGENCQREKLKDELNSNTAECVICTDLLGATEQVWPCKNCYNIFHLYCIRRWAKTNLDTEIVGAWICPVCRRPKYITPNRLRYRCLCGRLPKPKLIDGVTPHCCGKKCIRQCTHLCHPGPCRPPSPLASPTEAEQPQPSEKPSSAS